ncbi:MAG: hypothetical protein ACRDNI_11565 [Gaiellaceae bacterium]
MNVSTERFARNQDIFREVNERLREVSDPSARLTEYLCECSDVECRETIELDLVDYDAIRARPNAFLIAPGHEKLEVERVVEDENDRYMLVEKVALIDESELGGLLPRPRKVDPHGL